METKGRHPTCHKLSLTIATKLVALFDMAFGLFGLVWFVIMLSRYSIISLDPFENLGSGGGTGSNNAANLDMHLESVQATNQKSQAFAVNHKVISLSLVAFYTIVNLSVFVLLMVGVYKRSPGICLVWFHIRCAIFVFKLIILVMYILGGRPLFNQIPFIVSMLVHLYGLWIVSSYVDELHQGKHQLPKVEGGSEQQSQESVQDKKQDIYDVPNGIEAILRSRLMEAQQLQAKAKESV